MVTRRRVARRRGKSVAYSWRSLYYAYLDGFTALDADQPGLSDAVAKARRWYDLAMTVDRKPPPPCPLVSTNRDDWLDLLLAAQRGCVAAQAGDDRALAVAREQLWSVVLRLRGEPTM